MKRKNRGLTHLPTLYSFNYRKKNNKMKLNFEVYLNVTLDDSNSFLSKFLISRSKTVVPLN